MNFYVRVFGWGCPLFSILLALIWDTLGTRLIERKARPPIPDAANFHCHASKSDDAVDVPKAQETHSKAQFLAQSS
jgi:hypothetical protein